MNTSSLTASPPRSEQAIVIRVQARQLRERIAVRAGLALIAWGRRHDEHRTHVAMYERRHNEQVANRLRDDEFIRAVLLARPLI
ncbi:hypothetical protein QFZ29_003597 [Agromyces albus]|nr:hypothetical protein [Agromyces albus]